MSRIPKHRTVLMVFVLAVVLTGCGGRAMMPSPNIYVRAQDDPFAKVPETFRTNTVDVLYGTDRTPAASGAPLAYTSERSMSLAFGSCKVQIGENLTWEQLVQASRSKNRSVNCDLGT